MDLNQTLSELTALPLADRFRVLETVWDSIAADVPASISREDRQEIERRIDAHQANPNELLSWNQVLERLRGKL